MVVVGGQAPKAIRSVECFDFKEQRWFQLAELPSRRCRAGKLCVCACVCLRVCLSEHVGAYLSNLPLRLQEWFLWPGVCTR